MSWPSEPVRTRAVQVHPPPPPPQMMPKTHLVVVQPVAAISNVRQTQTSAHGVHVPYRGSSQGAIPDPITSQAQAAAQNQKPTVQGNAILSVVATQLEVAADINFKGNPPPPNPADRPAQARPFEPPNPSRAIAGPTVQGDAVKSIVAVNVKTQGSLNFGA